MKTIFYSLAVVMGSFFIMANASAQYHPYPDDGYHRRYNDRCRDGREQSFYYFPQSNVYYSFSTGNYIFFDHNAWVVTQRLPHYYRLRSESRFVVYHNGFDVWNDNRFHCMKYHDYRRFSPDVAYDRRGDNNDYGYPDRDRNDNWRK